jgi:hypothetical protein
MGLPRDTGRCLCILQFSEGSDFGVDVQNSADKGPRRTVLCPSHSSSGALWLQNLAQLPRPQPPTPASPAACPAGAVLLRSLPLHRTAKAPATESLLCSYQESAKPNESRLRFRPLPEYRKYCYPNIAAAKHPRTLAASCSIGRPSAARPQNRNHALLEEPAFRPLSFQIRHARFASVRIILTGIEACAHQAAVTKQRQPEASRIYEKASCRPGETLTSPFHGTAGACKTRETPPARLISLHSGPL